MCQYLGIDHETLDFEALPRSLPPSLSLEILVSKQSSAQQSSCSVLPSCSNSLIPGPRRHLREARCLALFGELESYGMGKRHSASQGHKAFYGS